MHKLLYCFSVVFVHIVYNFSVVGFSVVSVFFLLGCCGFCYYYVTVSNGDIIILPFIFFCSASSNILPFCFSLWCIYYYSTVPNVSYYYFAVLILRLLFCYYVTVLNSSARLQLLFYRSIILRFIILRF